MTRKSRREIERAIDDLDGTGGEPVTFAEFCEYYQHCIEEHGSLSAGPTPLEYFGHELSEKEAVEHWKRLIRAWDKGGS